MTAWEYFLVEVDTKMFGPSPSDSAVDKLNELGKGGWELVNIWVDDRTRLHAAFKRPTNPHS